jgi:multiple sugar transport system permease protein
MRDIPPVFRLLLIVGIVLIAATTIVPSIYVLGLSLVDPAGGFSIWSYRWVLSDPLAARVLANTCLFAGFGALVQVAFGLAVAKSLAEIPARMQVVLVLLLLAPWLVSEMASVVMWRWILAADVGPLDTITTWLGIGPLRLLAKTQTVKTALVAISVWRGLAFSTLFLFAALITIPSSLYRAAAIEGLGYWRRLHLLEFPLLKKALFSAGLVVVLHNVNQFTLPARLTGGGPQYASTMISNYLFDQLAVAQNLSISAAGGALTMALFGVLWLLTRLIMRQA